MSIFVDAVNAGNILRELSPSSFRILTNTPIPFHYINDGHHYHFEHPTFELDRFSGKILNVNYSPPFQAPFPVGTPQEVYDAFIEYEELLQGQSLQYYHTLKEGYMVIFDNRRVLHARTGFEDTATREDGGVNRWLKGCYFEGDAMADKARMLRKKLEREQQEGSSVF